MGTSIQPLNCIPQSSLQLVVGAVFFGIGVGREEVRGRRMVRRLMVMVVGLIFSGFGGKSRVGAVGIVG